jgi:hypothetical protein
VRTRKKPNAEIEIGYLSISPDASLPAGDDRGADRPDLGESPVADDI